MTENAESEDAWDRIMDRFAGTPDAALSTLAAALERAGEKHASAPNSRDGATIAMEAMCGFALQRFGGKAAAPFAALYAGLRDLDSGAAIPPMLTPRRPLGTGNRPVETGHRAILKLLAAVCVDTLHRNHGMRIQSAFTSVAGWLNSLKIELSGHAFKITAITIKHWRSDIGARGEFADQKRAFIEVLDRAKSIHDVEAALKTLAEALGKPQY